jgi:hypothetical protein
VKTRSQKRRELCERQRWRCWYCNKTMRWVDYAAHFEQRQPLPRDAATIEHLDDRFSPERGKHSGERRQVAACHGCNNRRARERVITCGRSQQQRAKQEISA